LTRRDDEIDHVMVGQYCTFTRLAGIRLWPNRAVVTANCWVIIRIVTNTSPFPIALYVVV